MLQRLPDIGGLIFMNRIQEAFKNKTAFIPFLTAGDPNKESTIAYILELEKQIEYIKFCAKQREQELYQIKWMEQMEEDLKRAR